MHLPLDDIYIAVGTGEHDRTFDHADDVPSHLTTVLITGQSATRRTNFISHRDNVWHMRRKRPTNCVLFDSSRNKPSGCNTRLWPKSARDRVVRRRFDLYCLVDLAARGVVDDSETQCAADLLTSGQQEGAVGRPEIFGQNRVLR